MLSDLELRGLSARATQEYERAPKVRVADLRTGDLTQHAGGSCTCDDPFTAWRVEELERSGAGSISVTWSHPACGVVAPPVSCHVDCAVALFGEGPVT